VQVHSYGWYRLVDGSSLVEPLGEAHQRIQALDERASEYALEIAVWKDVKCGVALVSCALLDVLYFRDQVLGVGIIVVLSSPSHFDMLSKYLPIFALS